VLFSHGPNKTFLEPYSRRATERNGNSISADVTDHNNEKIRTNQVSDIFRQFGSCFGIFDIAG